MLVPVILAVFTTVFVGLFLAGSGIAANQLKSTRSRSRWALVVPGLLLLIGRIPSITYSAQLNTDESQLLAQGLTLAKHPRFWESVDGTTTGPLASFVLTWPSLFGFETGYLQARITGLILILISLFFFYKALSVRFSAGVAYVGLLISTAFFAFATHFDLVHYSSELVALPLIAVLWWQWMRLLTTSSPLSALSWLWTGLLAGLTPFAKLQAVPVVGLLALGLVVSLLCSGKPLLNGNRRAALIFVAGGLLPSFLVVGYCLAFGVWDNFWTFYIRANLSNYHELQQHLGLPTHRSILTKLSNLPHFLWVEPTVRYLFCLGLSSAVVLAIAWRRWLNKGALAKAWALVIWLWGSFYVAIAPGTEFHHHLLFIVLPVTWLVSTAFAVAFSRNRVNYIMGLYVIGQLATLLPMWTYGVAPFLYNPYLATTLHNRTSPPSAVGAYLRRHAHEGDQLAVWGWNTTYYVEAQLAQGVSENHSFRSAVDHSLQSAYLAKYMQDLKRNQPVWIVDATGPASFVLSDPTRFRMARYPCLKRYLHTQYRLQAVVEGQAIFVRADRFPQDRPVTAMR